MVQTRQQTLDGRPAAGGGGRHGRPAPARHRRGRGGEGGPRHSGDQRHPEADLDQVPDRARQDAPGQAAREPSHGAGQRRGHREHDAHAEPDHDQPGGETDERGQRAFRIGVDPGRDPARVVGQVRSVWTEDQQRDSGRDGEPDPERRA
jgi:hypothetical protein